MMSVIKFRSLFLALLVSFGFLPGGTPTAYAQTEPAQTEFLPKCETPTVKGDPDCWLKVENHDNCYLWISPRNEQKITWSGQCRAGKLHGRGQVTWKSEGKETASHIGSYMDGKKNGRWNIRFPSGAGHTGPYVDGKKHGQWEERGTDGSVYTGSYVDGKRQGQWGQLAEERKQREREQAERQRQREREQAERQRQRERERAERQRQSDREEREQVAKRRRNPHCGRYAESYMKYLNCLKEKTEQMKEKTEQMEKENRYNACLLNTGYNQLACFHLRPR